MMRLESRFGNSYSYCAPMDACIQEFLHCPHMIGDVRGHCWSDPQRAADAHEIVMGKVYPEHCDQVLQLLRERDGQPSEPPQECPAAEVVPLRVAGADVARIGIAGYGLWSS